MKDDLIAWFIPRRASKDTDQGRAANFVARAAREFVFPNRGELDRTEAKTTLCTGGTGIPKQFSSEKKVLLNTKHTRRRFFLYQS